MIDRERIAQLEAALEYAINEADGWYDDSWGGKIDEPQMDAARALLPRVEWKADRREREYEESHKKWLLTHAESPPLTANDIARKSIEILSKRVHLHDMDPSTISTTTLRIRMPIKSS